MINFIQVQTRQSIRFDAMPEGSRNGWILWAQSHDWGTPDHGAWFDDMTGELVTYVACHEEGRGWFIEEARHSTPADLKEWAGY